jgi:hypothetical protein
MELIKKPIKRETKIKMGKNIIKNMGRNWGAAAIWIQRQIKALSWENPFKIGKSGEQDLTTNEALC